jgi:hypothetical protein
MKLRLPGGRDLSERAGGLTVSLAGTNPGAYTRLRASAPSFRSVGAYQAPDPALSSPRLLADQRL